MEVFAPVVIIQGQDLAIQTLDVGGLMINDSSDFRYDGMPFGGTKNGSMGREGVHFAAEEITQSKVICYRKSPCH